MHLNVPQYANTANGTVFFFPCTKYGKSDSIFIFAARCLENIYKQIKSKIKKSPFF